MDALRRRVLTYGGYDELWSDDYRLRIRYHRPREYYLRLVNGVWEPEDTVHPFMAQYLRSAAVFACAAEKCADIHDICEYLSDCEALLPEELLRLLLDDRGLSMDEAMRLVIKVFGRALKHIGDHDFLFDMQPRTAALTKVLKDELPKYILHEPYNADYRSPLGAVECGSEIRLSACTFGVEVPKLHLDCGEAHLELEPQDGDLDFRFTLELSGDWRYRFVSDSGKSDEARLTVYKKGFATPDWAKGRIMYQIFPDRFGFGDCAQGIEYHRSLGQTPELHESIADPVRWQARSFESDYSPDDFYGGTLDGIRKKLPYLRSLGVGIIYLNPVVEARSNHRYDCSDYTKVDPILGSVEDYVNLCADAKRLGIAVISDGVFSHTGADSVYFNRYGSYPSLGAWQSEESPYRKWYDFGDYPQGYRCWWGFRELPEVRESDPDWQDCVISGDDAIVKLWLRRGASGWRLDVADELPDDVLELIRRSAKEEKPDALIIGEVWEDAVSKVSYGSARNYALGYSLDSVMNYPFRKAVTDFVLSHLSSFRLRDFLLSQKFNYPKPMYECLMNLLGSHDVERLHTLLSIGIGVADMSRPRQAELRLTPEQSDHGTRLQRLAAAIQYSVPGIPCLYYGDEECLDGGRDPFNRAPFEPQKRGLYSYYARLGELRRLHPALMHGDMELCCPSEDVIEIYRKTESETLVCVINRSRCDLALGFAGTPLLGVGKQTSLPAMSAELYLL